MDAVKEVVTLQFFEEKNMKEFNPNKPYYRRDEKPAKIVHKFKDGRFLVVWEKEDGVETYYNIHHNGFYYTPGRPEHFDLINIPEKIEGWVIFYKDGTVSKRLSEETKNEYILPANKHKFNQIACIKVSFTEGEGLE